MKVAVGCPVHILLPARVHQIEHRVFVPAPRGHTGASQGLVGGTGRHLWAGTLIRDRACPLSFT